MLIKKFNGSNLEEIQREILNELGPDAVILTVRPIDNGFFASLFFGEEYEVTVGIEKEEMQHTSTRVEKELMQKMIGRIKQKEQGAKDAKSQALKIPVTGPLKFSKEQNVVALVGSRPSGKPLVATQLAVSWQAEGHKVALVSLKESDPELWGFAMMNGLTHYIVSNSEEFHRLLKGLSDFDIILFDLPEGCLFMDIERYLKPIKHKTVLLALSAAESIQTELMHILRYRPLNPYGLIITHLRDETYVDFLLPLTVKQNLPISYLMEGESMKIAEPYDLENRISKSQTKVNT